MNASGFPPRTCPACGIELDAAARFCPSCGEARETTGPTASRAPTEVASQTLTAPSASSASVDAARFAPGTMLADRYRIVSLLGRGGMGEVYRSEDLKLGQTVALKFLPPGVARDPAARQRLYHEVRLGRQISHSNVCRVFDVVEWKKHVFVAMEYIDGEDLASLLRRIGALPAAKVEQLAHEICAGLAAAHRLGVVHRDLKPANVMIDGHGSARITDFGLAVLAEEAVAEREIAGTPLYMAPEQLRGEPASAQSDLYAFGLLLFEMLAGRRLFDAATHAELLRQHASDKSPALASSMSDADPALRRVVARCLEERPEERPESVHSVLAALPGGDPLQAALDAGETPSPEMVAAAEGSGGLRPVVALLAFATLLVLVLLNAHFTERWGQVPGYIEVPERPEAMATRAGDLLREVGISVRSGDHDHGWDFDWERRHWVAENGFGWRQRGRTMAPSPVWFWYRHSPIPLDPFNQLERITVRDPPLDHPGMARVRLDAQGRLLSLTVVPPQRLAEAGDADPPDEAITWEELLEATGLAAATLQPAEPRWTPPVGATGRRAWTGTYPEQPDLAVRVEAAEAAGRPVWLEVIPPWVVEARESPPDDSSGRVWETTEILRSFVFLTLVLLAALLARRNLRRGRGDLRGALRLALFIGSTSLVYLLARVDFVAARIAGQTISQVGSAIAEAVIASLAYLAIEPYLRRSWPRILVGWHRLMSGRLRDPRIGREVLVGLVVALAYAAVGGELAVRMAIADIPYSPPLQVLGRSRDLVAAVFEALQGAGLHPVIGGLVLVLATFVLRRKAPAVAGLWLTIFVLGWNWIFDLRYALVLQILFATLVVVMLCRVGMVGFGVFMAAGAVVDMPMTLDPGHWYFVHSLVPLLLLVGLGAWAAWRSLGEQPDLAAWLDEERR